jgi:hypothetical protein
MSKRKERTNVRLGYLNKINYLDKRIKKNDKLGDVDEMTKLLRERESLTNKLKTKR